MSAGVRMILSHERELMIELSASLLTHERARQIAQEGFAPDGDDRYSAGELAAAAAAYMLSAAKMAQGARPEDIEPPAFWPWDRKWFKPRDPRSDTVRAGALALAELERQARADTFSVELQR